MANINWKKLDVPGCKPDDPRAEEKERMKNAKAGHISGFKRRLRKH
jgi:hypothetical protein